MHLNDLVKLIIFNMLFLHHQVYRAYDDKNFQVKLYDMFSPFQPTTKNVIFSVQVNKPAVIFIDEIDALATRCVTVIMFCSYMGLWFYIFWSTEYLFLTIGIPSF